MKNMKYILCLIFVLALQIQLFIQDKRIDQLEEKVRIQRVEIDSLVKNKAWRKHE